MTLLSNLAAIVLCMVSVGAAYTASRHCRWSWLCRLPHAGIWIGLMSALAAFIVWSRELGIGAALCLVLGCWALLAAALPMIAAALPGKTR